MFYWKMEIIITALDTHSYCYRYFFSEAPIYMCPEQHLICCSCWERVAASARSECVICRAPYPRGVAKRHRYLERAAEELRELRLKRQTMLDRK